MAETDPREELSRLSSCIRQWQHEYYLEGRPSVSDIEYDKHFDRLLELESRYPEFAEPDSPAKRVGSDLSSDFPEVRHSIPVLSLDKAYSDGDVFSWIRKTGESMKSRLSFVVEEKIDGVSIVLYYENGRLARAVTRGNGFVGNDVTANVMTVRTVPLRLPRPLDIAVRGEIFITRENFTKLNGTMDPPYANPRNLAAGTIRRIKSSEVAAIPLSIFVYEGFILSGTDGMPETHVATLELLEELGFPVNRRTGFFSPLGIEEAVVRRHPDWMTGNIDAFEKFVLRECDERKSLPYDIDGLVVKVNELQVRERLGYTGHHPRWALAYKFEAPEGVSTVLKIEVQIGRTGRVTPVARIEPVQVGGATISNITLHNQAYITMLELSEGDSVAVSRRGDVIPAIERVIEKNEYDSPVYTIPEQCPVCGSDFIESGAHHFCPNPSCPAQIQGRIRFFCAKNQMDIQNLGAETVDTLIEHGIIRSIPDIYTCDYSRLLEIPGFGEKKVNLIREGVEKSRQRPFRVVLASLGIPELGPKVSELLIDSGRYRSIDELLELADKKDVNALLSIPGIGPGTAGTIVEELSSPELKAMIDALRVSGLQFTESPEIEASAEDLSMAGQSWCVTGSFDNFKPRERAMEEVKKRGGRVVSQVTSKTTHLLAGSSAGSKLAQAQSLGVKIVNEAEFLNLLQDG